jgi:glycosyltransferase involved in cell wall biosynthesis
MTILNNEISPKVTIGIFVYNEEKNLDFTIKSILDQGFKDFELIVSDNNSTDGSASIAKKHAEEDSRIIYFKQERNVGALQNQNTLFKKAKGEYFVLAGGHDLWSDNYLYELVKALDGNPNASIAYGRTIWIDNESGSELNIKTGYVDTSGYKLITRYNLVLWSNQHPLYGLFRMSDLMKTKLEQEIIGSGAFLLSELSLIGDLMLVPEVIWYRRVNRNKESFEDRLDRYYRILFSKKRYRLFPHWRLYFNYLTVTSGKKLSITTRLIIISNTMFIVPIIYRNELLYDFVSLFRRCFGLKKKK